MIEIAGGGGNGFG